MDRTGVRGRWSTTGFAATLRPSLFPFSRPPTPILLLLLEFFLTLLPFLLDYLALIPRIGESRYLHASEQASNPECVPEVIGGLARGSLAMRTRIANLLPTTSTDQTT